jgi:hypothetical protein
MYFCEHIIPVLEQLGARLTSLREQPPTHSLHGDFNARTLSYETSYKYSLVFQCYSSRNGSFVLALATTLCSEITRAKGFGKVMA